MTKKDALSADNSKDAVQTSVRFGAPANRRGLPDGALVYAKGALANASRDARIYALFMVLLRSSLATALTLATTLLISNDALAEGSSRAKRWYGLQTLGVDGAAVGLALGGIIYDAPALTMFGVGTYALGPPIVHVAHGKVVTGLASVGIRLLAPLAGGAVGGGVGYIGGGGLTNDGFGPLTTAAVGATLGIAIGYFGAVVADAGALAYEDAKSDDASQQRRQAPRVVPMFNVMRDGNASAGVAGTF
jgi:hypothetical protein